MIRCPKCKGTDELFTVERLFATCRIDKDGNHDDYTDINWNSQETVTDTKGRWLFCCKGCGHEWYRKHPEEKTCKTAT
jgi:hypothetical protein